MFFHLLKYKIKQLFRNRETSLWVFIFPLLLGTLFYLGFGNLMKETERFEPIPIAAVSVQNTDSPLTQVIRELSQENENQLFTVTWTSEKKATQLLKKKKVDGIFYLKKKPSLTILENGLNQSILNSFLTQYLSQSYVLQQIGTEHPEQLSQATSQLFSDVSFNKEISVSQGSTNCLIQYFYALIAMVCLYGSILGQDASFSIQPHLSPMGARKNVAPAHKLKIILADFLACVIVNYLSILLLFFYLIVILEIDFGSRIPQALLVSLVGSIIGVSLGILTGSIGKWSRSTKEGFSMAVCMLCCFLGGLMINTLPNILSHTAPWINRINPATLISDSFYSLNVYTDYSRYYKNLVSMLVIAVIFCLGSYLILRRKTAD